MQPAERSRQHSHIALVLSSRYHEACGTPLWKEGERVRGREGEGDVCMFIHTGPSGSNDTTSCTLNVQEKYMQSPQVAHR